MKIDLNELRRTRATESARRYQLNDTASKLRNGIRTRQGDFSPPAVAFGESIKTAVNGFNLRQHKREAEIVQFGKELAIVEREITELDTVIQDAHKKILQAEEAEDRERRLKISSAVEAAASAVPSERQAYLNARTKLTGLQLKLTTAVRELDQEIADPHTREDNTAESARKLVDTGELDSLSSCPDTSARVKKLMNEVRIFRDAVRIQERAMLTARRSFTSALLAHLKPAMKGVVGDIVNGYCAARAAMVQARLLRVAVAVATGGGDDQMTCLEYAGVQLPQAPGQDDGFINWQNAKRCEGLL